MQKQPVPVMDKKVHGYKQNKYNLQTYSKTFEFIHNNRTKTRKERFMEILCYQ